MLVKEGNEHPEEHNRAKVVPAKEINHCGECDWIDTEKCPHQADGVDLFNFIPEDCPLEDVEEWKGGTMKVYVLTKEPQEIRQIVSFILDDMHAHFTAKWVVIDQLLNLYFSALKEIDIDEAVKNWLDIEFPSCEHFKYHPPHFKFSDYLKEELK